MMEIDLQTRNEIKALVFGVLVRKIENYSGDGAHKPFFDSIFSKDQVLTHYIIHSFYTTFGMSIYEQIAKILAESAGFVAEKQHTLRGTIDPSTEELINAYWNGLKSGLKNKSGIIPCKAREIEMIKDSIIPGQPNIDGDSTVDLFIQKPDRSEFYFDITTVKNNLKSFEVMKLKMLRWIALRASIDKTVDVNSFIVIPYNPYYPEDYIDSQWNSTIIDRNGDILVQEEFWNFVGNSDSTYDELIAIFQEVGEELKERINDFFSHDIR